MGVYDKCSYSNSSAEFLMGALVITGRSHFRSCKNFPDNHGNGIVCHCDLSKKYVWQVRSLDQSKTPQNRKTFTFSFQPSSFRLLFNQWDFFFSNYILIVLENKKKAYTRLHKPRNVLTTWESFISQKRSETGNFTSSQEASPDFCWIKWIFF